MPPDDQVTDDKTTTTTTADTTTTAKGSTGSADTKTDTKATGDKTATGTLATGNAPDPKEQPAYWPTDWREKAAQHISAGDEKAYKKELKRLETIADPTQMYASFRSMENVWATKQFVKLPGKDAKEEEIAEYHKSIGVPEKPEDYLKDLKLPNGLVIGEADKPMVDQFAQIAHKTGASPKVVSEVLGWYLGQQEQQAADLDENDTKFRDQSQQALKAEFGPAFARYTNNIASLFATAPGGADAGNPKALLSRLMGGRTADGQIIGNDPDVVRFMSQIANSINPAGSVVEDGDQSGGSVMTEIDKIEKTMRDDRQKYNKDVGMQNRYRELLEVRAQIQERKRA